MKYPIGKFYVEFKDKQDSKAPTEKVILLIREEPPLLRIQYQLQNEKNRKDQKLVKNDNDELEVKPYPKNKKNIFIENPQINLPSCPTGKQDKWIEFNKSNFCPGCEYITDKQKHENKKEVLRQDKKFSTRLPYDKQRLTKFIFLWLIPNIIQQKTCLIN